MSERNETGPGQGGPHSYDDDFDSPRREDDPSYPDHSSENDDTAADNSDPAKPADGGNDSPDADDGDVLEGDIDDRDEWQRRFDDLVADLDTVTDISYAPTGAGPQAPPDPRDEPTLLEKWDRELPPDPEDEETYEPPPPPPIPWPSLPGLAGVLSIVAGILIFVRPEWLPFGSSGGRLIGFVAFIFGVSLLISRLREEPEEDERPDDGAVVLWRLFPDLGRGPTNLRKELAGTNHPRPGPQ